MLELRSVQFWTLLVPGKRRRVSAEPLDRWRRCLTVAAVLRRVLGEGSLQA
jgi:hypothetical protein